MILSKLSTASPFGRRGSVAGNIAYQSTHGAVKGMTVVAAELGVDTLQRGVPRGLGLLNAGVPLLSAGSPSSSLTLSAAQMNFRRSFAANVRGEASYPLRCALRDWLC